MAKVMLVEDDNNLREIYEARLQAEGYTIVSARDGEEALVVAKKEQPDLIISDVMMPKISGFEMLDILRNTDGLKEVKVIMLTALGQSDDQQRADKLGADRYLVKSQVTLEDIVKVTHDLLGDAPADEPAATPAPAAVTASSAPADEPAVAATPVPEPAADSGAVPDTSTPAATPSGPFSPVEVPASSESTSDDTKSAESTAPKPDSTDSDNLVVQSTNQEEASVEAKIEDFVASASSDSDAVSPSTGTDDTTQSAAMTEPPETEPAPELAAAASEPPAPAAATETQAAMAASDDKLMADAVNTLVTNTEDTVAADEPAKPVVLSPATSGATTTSSAPAEEPAPPVDIEAVPTETVGDGTTIAHKKIIKPIDSEPKQDLDVLLAKEAAKEAAAQPDVPPVVVSSDGPATPPTEPEPGKVDPNSIAL